MASDELLAQDKKQGGPNAVWCVLHQHGRLACHRDGQTLVCGTCGYHVPVSAENK